MNQTTESLTTIPVLCLQWSSSLTMFRAMYDFTSREATALSFQCSDQFTVMDTSDPYWWLVQNGYGQIGYVPASYLQQIEVSLNNQVNVKTMFIQ